MAVTTAVPPREQELLVAARRGDEDAFRRLVEPAQRTAPGPLLPDARLAARRRGRASKKPCCARGGLCPSSRVEARRSPGSTGSRRTRVSTRSGAGPSVSFRSTTARRAPLQVDLGEPLVESGVGRALPGRSAGGRGWLCGTRGALRTARGRGARVHRRVAASAGHAARCARSTRGARILGQGGRRVAGDDGRLGQQRPPARPQDGRESAAGAESAGDAALARRRARPRARRRRTSMPGREAMSKLSAHSWPRTPCSRCHRGRSGGAAARRLRPSRRTRWRFARHPAPSRLEPTGSRPSPTTPWTPRPGAHGAAAIDVLTFEGARIKEITAFVMPEAFARFGLPRSLD